MHGQTIPYGACLLQFPLQVHVINEHHNRFVAYEQVHIINEHHKDLLPMNKVL